MINGLNVHRAKTLRVSHHINGSTVWFNLLFTDASGAEFSLTVFDGNLDGEARSALFGLIYGPAPAPVEIEPDFTVLAEPDQSPRLAAIQEAEA